MTPAEWLWLAVDLAVAAAIIKGLIDGDWG